MLALSIRQPWAWLIIRPDITDPDERLLALQDRRMKDIENRDWHTNVRGRILVHAAKGMTRDEYENGNDPLWGRGGPTIALPAFSELERGGIVGSVEIFDCVASSESPWFNGSFGFRLRASKPLPFTPYKGRLGFFNVPDYCYKGNPL